MIRSRCGKNKGSVMVMAVVLSFVTILIGVTFLTFAVTLRNQVTYEIASKQAIYDSYAGAMQGVLNKIASLPGQSGWTDFYDDNQIAYRIISEGFQDIQYGISTNLRIVGMGRSTYQGIDVNKEVMVEFNYESYADYLYLSNKERDSYRNTLIKFWTPDTLDGKVHSNDTIHVMGTPVFLERVTTTANYIDPPNNNAYFAKGWGLHSPIYFPDQVTEIRNSARYTWGTSGRDSLTQLVLSGHHIYVRKCGLFRQNGVDSIRCSPDYISSAPFVDVPSSEVVFVIGKALISASRNRPDLMDGPFPERINSGENFISDGFSGQLTIGSSDTMIIGDNIIYTHARSDNSVPSTMDSCSDILGLVSENYIMIGRQVRNTCYINAALAAVRGSISVQDIYMDHAPGWDNEKQSLFIYGCLAQRNRGIVHTTDFPPGHFRGFIAKKYHYDTRLHENPPPHYLPATQNSIVFHESLYDGD
jgi:hypothetical protein